MLLSANATAASETKLKRVAVAARVVDAARLDKIVRLKNLTESVSDGTAQ